MTTDYTNAAQQRLLQLIDLLAGHELQGLANVDVARSMNCGAPMALRDLNNLRTAGWAEQTPQGRWRLAPHVIAISERYAAGVRASVQGLLDTTQRYGQPAGLHGLLNN